MKKTLIKQITGLVVLGAMLAWANGTARADVLTNVLFNFDASGQAFVFPSWAAQGSGSWDSTQDAGGSAGVGSLYVYEDLSLGDQMVGFQNLSLNAYWPYAWNNDSNANVLAYIDLSACTNFSMDIKWDTTYSSLDMDAFNTESFAGGGGTWGLELDFVTGASQNWTYITTLQVPQAASNGWAHVNVPLPTGLSGVSQTVGFAIKKWTGSGYLGAAGFWIDNIAAEQSMAPPPPPTISPLAPPPAQGLNIYDDGHADNRQSIKTVVTTANGLNYGWVTNGAPVTYSVNIAQGTPDSYIGGQVHIMIMPGAGINDLAPDWNQANAIVLFIERQADGSVVGFLRYKLGQPSGNTYLFGSDTNHFGGSGFSFTNTIAAGYGGLLCAVTNHSGYVGTWSVRMTSATEGQVIYPDGSASFAFPQESDAQAFTGPVTVYWGVQPNSGSWYQDTVFSSVSVSGSLNTLNADLTQSLNPDLLTVLASSPAMVFATPTDARYWLEWSLPDSGYALQSASSLLGTWASVVGSTYPITNYLNSFGTSNYITTGRTWWPPPMFIGYEFGDDSAPTLDWVAGPTYDAGGSAGSGSVQLKWNWAGGSGNECFVIDVFQSGIDLSGGTLSFDIMIDPSSTAGTNNDYGYLDVISRDGSYNWNATTLSEPLLTAAGGATGTWAHVSIPLGTGAGSIVRALSIQITNDGDINGTQTVYLDNLQLTTLGGAAPTLHEIGANHATFIRDSMLPSSGSGFFRLRK
jgi:hypothetical protein